jgi:hypothetical protein
VEQLGFHWTGSDEIFIFELFGKSVEKFSFHEDPTRITGTSRDVFTFMIISQ